MNELSTRWDMTRPTLNNTVSGRSNSATVSTIQKICNGLDMELPEFFDSNLFHGLKQGIF